MSIDKAMENGIHCVGCTFVTTQLKPSDMYCPWCMKEAQDRIAELEAMVRELKNDGDNLADALLFIFDEEKPLIVLEWEDSRVKALALLNQEERYASVQELP